MLSSIAKSFGMTDIPESWKENFNEAEACRPEKLDFLEQSYFNYVRKGVVLSDANARLIEDAMKLIRQNEQLQMLAWLWHFILYLRSGHARENLSEWPAPTGSSSSKNLEDVFPAVVLLSGYERLERLHKERNIPEDVISDTMSSSLEGCMNAHKRRTGKFGLGMFYFNWLKYAFNARLYKIGRLQYEIRTFSNRIRVFSNVRGSKIITLSDDGVKYRGDGLVDGTNDMIDDTRGWVATLTETDDEIHGYPIHSNGYALREPVSLNKEEWRKVLSPGDPVIGIHIPRKGSFTHEVCHDSFVRAREFFSSHYAELSYAAMVCVSWLLDPQLKLMLAESSNLVQFQRRFQLYPVKSTDSGLYAFVFMCDRGEIDQLPEETSLQRNIKQFMQTGGRMHSAGGFILPESLKPRNTGSY